MDDRAEGTPTLIIFIAVLVAAGYAVATVIDVLTELGETSASQGKAASASVATNLRTLAVIGTRNTTSDGLWDVTVLAELPPGAPPTDATKILLRATTDDGARHYAHDAAALANGAPASTTYNATWIAGDGGGTFVIESGDRIAFHFNLVGAELAPRSTLHVVLQPEGGTPTRIDVTTPSSFGVSTVTQLM